MKTDEKDESEINTEQEPLANIIKVAFEKKEGKVFLIIEKEEGRTEVVEFPFAPAMFGNEEDAIQTGIIDLLQGATGCAFVMTKNNDQELEWEKTDEAYKPRKKFTVF